jgi:hypothetical protein
MPTGKVHFGELEGQGTPGSALIHGRSACAPTPRRIGLRDEPKQKLTLSQGITFRYVLGSAAAGEVHECSPEYFGS